MSGTVTERLSGLGLESCLPVMLRVDAGLVAGKREKDGALPEDLEDLASSSRQGFGRWSVTFCYRSVLIWIQAPTRPYLSCWLDGPLQLFYMALSFRQERPLWSCLSLALKDVPEHHTVSLHLHIGNLNL